MKTFRTIIVRFKNVSELQEFYKNEFKYMYQIFDRNIRINYRKSNLNQILLYGYDSKLKYKTDNLSEKELVKVFNIIDKMPMRKIDTKFHSSANNLYNMCGIPSVYSTQHCFADYTHQTCCLLGRKARDYANKSGNPIGTASEKIFEKYFGRKPLKNDLTPWCTCIGSKVCSFYANKFNDGTHIKFINSRGNNFLAYNFETKCEKELALVLNYTSHKTPGVDEIQYNSNGCEYKKYIYN